METKTHTTSNNCWLLLTLLLIVITYKQSFGQESYGIKGTVVDSLNSPVTSGNIIALSPIDSTVLKGTHFWDGKFELYGIEKKDVLLKLTAHGYQTLFLSKSLESDSSKMNLGVLTMTTISKELEDIHVVYHKPMFERELGKLIVNVEGTILSEKGTVLELLRSAPNVIVRSTGDIQVVGKGSAIIYLDGRRLNATEILNTISANDIEKIEIIETPSARYDAEGNAVIEIITRNGALNGNEGSIGLRGMFRTEAQMAYWGNFSFRKDWFSLYASIGQYTGTLHEDEDYYREVYTGTPTTMDNVVDREINHNFDTWYDLNMDFRIDSSATLFLNYIGARLQSKPFVRNSNLIYENETYIGSLDSESRGLTTQYTHSVATGFNKDLDTLGSEFRITGQYTSYDNSTSNDIFQTSNFGSPILQSFNNQSFNGIKVLSAQTEWSHNFSSDNNISTGVKFSSVSNQSGVDFKNQSDDTWVTDSSLYNQFDYQENILAGFVEWKGKRQKLHYSAGLRYEGTDIQGNSFVSGTGVVDRTYHNLFPNVQLGYYFTPDLVLGASYNYRIARPQYQDLDPFVTFIDSLTSFRGNPQLLPTYSHNAELSLIYMEYASIKLGYSRAINPIFLTVVKDPSVNTFAAINQNITSSEVYNIGLVIPWENEWWTTFNAFGYMFNNYSIQSGSEIIANTEPTYYISLYNEFRIPKLFNLEISYEYTYPGAQGFFIARPFHYLMAGISRNFLKDRLNLNFTMFDPFKFSIERADANLGSFYVNYSSWMDNRSFMLTARWSFGKMKNSTMIGEGIDSDEQDRINN